MKSQATPRVYAAYFAASIVALTLQACTTFGVPTPETFNQRVAFSLTQVTAIRDSAANLLRSDVISADDADNVNVQANTARAGIDLASSFHATDPAKAENRLAAADLIIEALKGYLKAQEQPQ